MTFSYPLIVLKHGWRKWCAFEFKIQYIPSCSEMWISRNVEILEENNISFSIKISKASKH